MLTSFVHKAERYYCGNKLEKEEIKTESRTLSRVISVEWQETQFTSDIASSDHTFAIPIPKLAKVAFIPL